MIVFADEPICESSKKNCPCDTGSETCRCNIGYEQVSRNNCKGIIDTIKNF